jgi:hypothetical protein
MSLLLLDDQIQGLDIILRCLKSNVTPVLFDFKKDSFESITEKIPEKRYSHLGILKAPRLSDTYCLMASFGESILKDVDRYDPALDTWTSFYLLVELCVSRLGVQCLDMIECFPTRDLDYLSNQWDLQIRYSSSPLGKTANGSNWTLNGESLIHVYFTKEIESYPYMIGYTNVYMNEYVTIPIVPYEKQILFRILHKKK